jgi:hypothetical protein
VVLSLPTGDDPLVVEAEDACRRRGAIVLRVPGGAQADRRLAAITTFPASLALAARLGMAAGLDVDRPTWIDAYYTVARCAA